MGEGATDMIADQAIPSNVRIGANSRMRHISILRSMNGFMVTVGCQSLVFNSTDQLLIELRRYIENPRAVELEYLEKFKDSSQ